MKSIVVGLFLWAVATGAWAQQPSDKLGVGDALRITVFQQPDLTTETRVTEKGTVNMPLIGEIKVAGLSAQQAGSAIAESFKKGQYLKNPQVNVAVTTVRSQQVSVIGLVTRPGRYGLEDTNYKVTDVIAAAGGFAPDGSSVVTVIRDGKPQKVDILKTSFALKHGDTVVVERAPVFYIYGEVTRGGAYRVEENMTVMFGSTR